MKTKVTQAIYDECMYLPNGILRPCLDYRARLDSYGLTGADLVRFSEKQIERRL